MRLVVKGKLEFLGWKRPWMVDVGARRIDIAEAFWQVARSLRGRPSTLKFRLDQLSVNGDPASEYDLEYGEIGGGVIVSKHDGFGFSNVASYLEMTLCGLNGREIIASSDDDGFSVLANIFHEVPAVAREERGNMAVIPPGMESGICRIGQGADTCIFLTGGAEGFRCAKFSGAMGRMLLDRKAEGKMSARRIGDCRLLHIEEVQP